MFMLAGGGGNQGARARVTRVRVSADFLEAARRIRPHAVATPTVENVALNAFAIRPCWQESVRIGWLAPHLDAGKTRKCRPRWRFEAGATCSNWDSPITSPYLILLLLAHIGGKASGMPAISSIAIPRVSKACAGGGGCAMCGTPPQA